MLRLLFVEDGFLSFFPSQSKMYAVVFCQTAFSLQKKRTQQVNIYKLVLRWSPQAWGPTQTHRGFLEPRKCLPTQNGPFENAPPHANLPRGFEPYGLETCSAVGKVGAFSLPCPKRRRGSRWWLRRMIFGEHVQTATASEKPQWKQRVRPASSHKSPW